MERPASRSSNISNEGDSHRPHGQQPRRNSLTPSMRRERPMLRSSPLAGTSYSTDGAGNVIEHTSALEEEIARRQTMLSRLNDHDLSRLAALPSPSTPALSHSSSPNPSRKGSLETTEEGHRRARPSFISLGPQGSRPGSRDSLVPPTPTSLTLRTRHSSPQLSDNAKLKPNPKPELGAANWMTAAPVGSFSRAGVRGSGVVLPVKASSRAAERIRQRSASSQPAAVAAKRDTHSESSTKPRSLKSFRSMSRLLRGSGVAARDEESHSIPALRSYASSLDLGSSSSLPPSPATPDESTGPRTYERFSPLYGPQAAIADSDATPSRFTEDAFTEDAEEACATGDSPKHEEGERANRVKRLWTKVRKWRVH